MRSTPLAAAVLLAAQTVMPIVGSAKAADVEVRVVNVRDARGTVRAELCQKAEWLQDGCTLKARAPATPGLTTLTFTNVPPGPYAVVAFHDSNDDGDVNRTAIGIPEEGVGFSGNPALGLRGPKFEQCAFTIGEDTTVIDVRLRFE